MDTIINLTSPDCRTPKFIPVPSLCEQNITGDQSILLKLIEGEFNLLDDR